MYTFESTIELIKQIRGKIIEFVSRDCMGCNDTAESLREHICYSTPWYIHCCDYWDNMLQDLELTQLPKETLLKYFAIVSEIDPVEVDPENEEIILKMVIDTGVLE
jgi:hypothetical protein